MLFHQLPTFVLVLMMFISCAVKHVGIRRLVRKPFFVRLMAGAHWYWAVCAVAGFSAIAIFLIFMNFVGCKEASVFAITDFVAMVFTGLYIRLSGAYGPTIKDSNYHVIIVDTLHVLLYLIYVDTAIR